jgi:hypothetical protein
MVIPTVRPSPIAGLWYEGNPKALADSIDSYLDQAKIPQLDGNVVAIMSPHAGHRNSGAVAGSAFATIRGQTRKLVAILSPMHHPYIESMLVTAHKAYETPLGSIRVDRQLVDELDASLHTSLGKGISPVQEDPEHSLEIILPFLQRALTPGFELLPIMLREQTPQLAEVLGHELAKTLKGKDFLLVASTDLSHFFREEEARRYDAELLRQVELFSPQGIFEVDRLNTGFACGMGALAAVLWAAKDLGADTVKILEQATSGRITGDFDRVVGYGAAVVLQTNNPR